MRCDVVHQLLDEPVHGSTTVMLLGRDEYVLQICVEGLNSGVRILPSVEGVPQKYAPHVHFRVPMLVHVLHELLEPRLLMSTTVKLLECPLAWIHVVLKSCFVHDIPNCLQHCCSIFNT
jgi:hypothetical protein